MLKDKLKIKFNPIEGKFDLVQQFNPDRILTHELSQFGNPIQMFDPSIEQYYKIDDQIVFDENGNVITV